MVDLIKSSKRNPTPSPGGGGRRARSAWSPPVRGALALVLLAAAALLTSHSWLASSAGVGAARRLGGHGPEAGDWFDAPPGEHVQQERMLRALTEECARGEDSVIYLDEPSGAMRVEKRLNFTCAGGARPGVACSGWPLAAALRLLFRSAQRIRRCHTA